MRAMDISPEDRIGTLSRSESIGSQRLYAGKLDMVRAVEIVRRGPQMISPSTST
jgi:hypothetical protein